MNTIKIYGPGCKKCSDLTDLTKQIIAEQNLNCELVKISDPMDMAADGVMATPALAIDGKVMVKGHVPTHEQLSEILKNSGIPTGGCDCGGACEAPAAPAEEKPAPAESCDCGGACEAPAAEKAPEEKPAAASGCGCGSGGGCCSSEKGGNMGKQLVVWVILILVGFAIYKAMDNKKAAAADAAAAAAPAIESGVEAIYYHNVQRCVTCNKMEKWIKEAVEANFATELQSGKLAMKSLRISPDDKYKLQYASLIVKNIESGAEKSFVNAEKIWQHKGDEAAFKAYVVDEIKKALAQS